MNKTIIPQEALQQFNNRDEAGFKTVFYTLYKNLVAYSATMTLDYQQSEDIVITTLIKVWRGDAVFVNDEKLLIYLYKSIKNHTFNYLKSAEYKARKHTKDIDELDMPEISADPQLEKLAAMYEFIQTLPEQCREVVKLHLAGHSPKEISSTLNTAISTVNVQMHRAVKKLKQKFNIE